MKRTLVLFGLCFVVGGCLEDQATAYAGCRLEAISRYFNRPADETAGQATEACMKLRGYAKRESKYCPNILAREPDLICYQPDLPWGRVGFQIEMALRSPK